MEIIHSLALRACKEREEGGYDAVIVLAQLPDPVSQIVPSRLNILGSCSFNSDRT